jgi:hypothetical protein
MVKPERGEKSGSDGKRNNVRVKMKIENEKPWTAWMNRDYQ